MRPEPTPDLVDMLDRAFFDARTAKCQTPADVRVALMEAGWNFDHQQQSGVAVDPLGVISVWARNDDGGESILSNLEPVWAS